MKPADHYWGSTQPKGEEMKSKIAELKAEKEELIQFIKSISTRELDSINIVKRASLLNKIEGSRNE